ncbi:MAG TPA: TIGR03862 family flavoprotein, partial [Rhizomicrobium sp.]
FPKAMKASPLLRAWLARLETQGVEIKTRHEWRGWDGDGALLFDANGARVTVRADAAILALGGASWPKLGSDGSWSKLLEDEGVTVHPLKPSNSGFHVAWSGIFHERFAGQPIKNASFRFEGETARGEAMVTSTGIEGGAIYALSAALRDAIANSGKAALHIDLRPDLSEEQLSRLLAKPRGKESLSNFLRKAVKLSPLEINLLREGALDPALLARQIKNITITLTGAGPIARAISTAGGVGFESLDRNLMLKSKPGIFVAGEMLDWEAPTGGYLLQASFATGVVAAKGALAWLY